MTRPIYEPSLQRTDARLGYSTSQLLRRPAPASAGNTTEAAAVVSLNINVSVNIAANTWTLVVDGGGNREWASGWRSDTSWNVDLDSANSIERSEDAFYVAYGWVGFSDSIAGDTVGVGIRWRNNGGLFYPNYNVTPSTDAVVTIASAFWGVPSPGTDLWCFTDRAQEVTSGEMHVRRFELTSSGEDVLPP